MQITVPIHNRCLDSKRFIFAHPNERLHLGSRKARDGICTLYFGKSFLSVRFEEMIKSDMLLIRVFAGVLLRKVYKFVLTRINSPTIRSIVEDICVLDFETCIDEIKTPDSRGRRLFETMQYHFSQQYGALKNMGRGYHIYPPQPTPIFLPPLTMTRHETEENRPLMFHNEHHFAPVEFRSYVLENFITVINPSPIYDRNCNFAIRDYHTGVFEFRPMFEYCVAGQAKRSTRETNDCTRYMFLLRLNDRYYQVLTIYPKSSGVRKYLPTLDRVKGNMDVDGMNMQRIISRFDLLDEARTDQKIFHAFESQICDIVASEKQRVFLMDWLSNAVANYVSKLDFVVTEEENESNTGDVILDFENMSFGDIKIYLLPDKKVRCLLKLQSCLFVYTQDEKEEKIVVPHVHMYVDRKGRTSEAERFFRLASVLRHLFHFATQGHFQPDININDFALHEQLLLCESYRLNGLINVSKLAGKIMP